jgi:hypothetical protein
MRRELEHHDDPLWEAVHRLFVNDSADIGAFFVDSERFHNSRGELPDISVCKSKWATASDFPTGSSRHTRHL